MQFARVRTAVRVAMGACITLLPIAVSTGCGETDTPAAPNLDAGNLRDSPAIDGTAQHDDASVQAVDAAADTTTSSLADATPEAIVDAATADSAIGDAGLLLSAAWVWTYAGGDPLNATPPLLAADGDGVALAGASADPAIVGVAHFADASVTSEAFVGRLRHDGSSMWAAPLNGAGLPSGLAINADGSIVVSAPWLPNQPMVSTGYVGTDIYLGKFSAEGTPIYEKDIPLPSSAGAVSFLSVDDEALDSAGNVYVIGSLGRSDGSEAIAFTKIDSSGAVTWSQVFAGDGPGYEMTGYGVVVLPSGDVVIGGDFNGHANFGGGVRNTLFAGSYETMAYLARFTPAGQWVSDVTFGTGPASLVLSLEATSAGDLLVGGDLAGTATFGALTLDTAFWGATSYVVDLQSMDAGRWGALGYDGGPLLLGYPGTTAIATNPRGYVHATGSYDGRHLLLNYLLATGDRLADFTVGVADGGTGVAGSSLAVDSTQSVWVSGTFGERATFGTLTLDGSVPASPGIPNSIFVARLDPSGP